MLPDEAMLSGNQLRARLAAQRGHKRMHHRTLQKAIDEFDLPCTPNPFGKGYIFYWSEVEAWLINPQPVKPKSQPTAYNAPRRGPGRPRKDRA